MDRNQAKEFYPILQAFAEGMVIECRTKPSAIEDENVPNEWAEIKVIEFNGNKEYRIKPNLEPESEYRPFKDANGSKFVIENIDSSGFVEVYDDGTCTFKEVFEIRTFADGTPFGVKTEE